MTGVKSFSAPMCREIGVGDDSRGEHAVGVGRARRHEAVRREQDRRGEVRKFLLLVLPSRAEIPLEMGIFFQLRIGVRREHLAVRIDCDAAVCRLLQQELQVVQVMTGHNDKRSGLHGERDMDRGRLAEAFGVGFVQQRHAAQVDLAQLQHERQQLLHAPVLADGEQRFRQKAFDGLVPVAEHHGVIGIGCHAAAAEQQQRLQAADVLLAAPQSCARS